jgi:hypothetical protein
VGLYAWWNDTTGAPERHLTGFAAIVPYGNADRLVGFWSLEPYVVDSTTTPDSLFHWFVRPFTIYPSGQAASNFIGDETGGFYSDGSLSLIPTTGPWATNPHRFFVFLPINDARALADGPGVYQIDGNSGQIRWTGTIAFVQSPLRETSGAMLGRVFVLLQSEKGVVLDYMAVARQSAGGGIAAEPAALSASEVDTDVATTSGQMSGAIYIHFKKVDLIQRIEVHGVKQIAAQ